MKIENPAACFPSLLCRGYPGTCLLEVPAHPPGAGLRFGRLRVTNPPQCAPQSGTGCDAESRHSDPRQHEKVERRIEIVALTLSPAAWGQSLSDRTHNQRNSASQPFPIGG